MARISASAVLIAFAAAVATGCSSGPDNRHLGAKSAPPLEVPAGLDSPELSPELSLPDVPVENAGSAEPLEAPPELVREPLEAPVEPKEPEQPAASEPEEKPAPDGPELGRMEGGNLLVFGHYRRTWRLVGAALDRMELVVEDSNTARGYYVIRFSKALAEQVGADAARDYRLMLTPIADETTRVELMGRDGETLSSAPATAFLEQLLARLR